MTDTELQKLVGATGVVDTEPLFVMAYNEFLRDPKLKESEKLLFLNLKAYAGDKSSCFPSHTTLAKDQGIGRDKVIRALKGLQEKGALLIINQRKENNRKTANLYILAKYDPEKRCFNSESLEKYKCLQERGLKVKGK